MSTGSSFLGGLSAQNNLRDLLRPTAFRFPQRPRKHVHHRVGQRQRMIGTQLLKLRTSHAMAHQEQRHVAHHFAGWSHLHNVSEHLVHCGIGLGHFVPLRTQPHGFCLFFQIGELAAWHFVLIDTGCARLQPAIERQIVGTYHFPIIGTIVQNI